MIERERERERARERKRRKKRQEREGYYDKSHQILLILYLSRHFSKLDNMNMIKRLYSFTTHSSRLYIKSHRKSTLMRLSNTSSYNLYCNLHYFSRIENLTLVTCSY